jgi:sugar O-acyltransferase (sialic acid O-acetyltransferase NeuD family)
MKKILIIGASGHSKVIIDIIEKQNHYKILGLIDTYKEKGTEVLGYEILGTELDLPELIKEKNIKGGIIGIGDNWERRLMHSKIKDLLPDFDFVTAVHPESVVDKSVHIGEGSVIMAGTVVNHNAEIGAHCILNTISSLDHDSVMKDFSSLAPGSVVGGNVSIGTNSAISLGAIIRENVSVGDYTVIGAGSIVIKNIADYKVAYGVPAREIKERTAEDKYFSTGKKEYELKIWPLKSQKELEKYKTILKEFKRDSPFYNIEFLDIKNNNLSKTYCFEFRKNNVLLAFMPFHLNKIITTNEGFNEYYDVASPYGYSGPLFNNNLPTHELKEFWNHVDDWYKKNNVIAEFIRFSLNNNFIEYTGSLVPSLLNIKGRIVNETEQWDNFKPKVRNNYRKAEKENLVFKLYLTEQFSKEIIDVFYEIYTSTMVRNTADDKYFFPVNYFEALVYNNPSKIAIAIVYKDEVPISTELILKTENSLYSYLGGTKADYFNVRPNDYLKINVMNWGRKNFFEYYILGGGREDHDNLYKYKKAFFPNDSDIIFYTGRKIINPFIYNELIKNNNLKASKNKNLIDPNSFFPAYRKPSNG